LMNSTYHSEYPFMYPIERPVPALSPWELADARRIGRAVASRTGTRCFYNAAKGRLMWVYGAEPGGGPLAVDFKRRDGGSYHYHAGDIDDMVGYINRGKISRREKDRIAANDAAAEASDKEQQQGRSFDKDRREIENYADFLDKKRRGTGTLAVAV
jgi:hypothetical protein